MDEEDVEREGCCCFPRRRRNNNSNNNEEEAKKGWCFNLSRNGRTIMMMDLREFCLTDWFIPVSIGFTIAINFDKTIEQFVSSWITPLVGILFGEHHDDLVFTVRGSRFTYGLFIDSLLNTIFVFITVIFVLVLPFQAFRRKHQPKPDEVPQSASYSENVPVMAAAKVD